MGATALAGCSGGFLGSSDDGNDGNESDDEKQPVGSSSDAHHPGESIVEQHLTSTGFAWIELEDTSEQVADTLASSFLSSQSPQFDFQAETVTHQTGAFEGTTFDVDTAYIALKQRDSGEWTVRLGYIDGSKWKEGEGFEGNRFRATAFVGSTVEAAAVETMLSTDVRGYSDISESFPDQFRSLLDG